MKKRFVALCLISVGASVHASEYGCKVLLCLANPLSNGGPKGIAECIKPIEQLFRDLKHGRPFPTCGMADGNDGSSYARQVYDPYDPCPAPLQPAASGLNVVQGQRKFSETKVDWRERNGSFVLTGQPQPSVQKNGYGQDRERACVGRPVGSYTVDSLDNGYTATVFEKVVWQQAQRPRAIDVYIDRKWVQRVRW